MSNSTFYTDSNGLEMQKRIRDYRPSWNFSSVLNVTQNYYPINSAIVIRDETSGNQMSLMTTRAHGGSSLIDGQLELMHHRRIFHDDHRGVGEVLNETDESGQGIQVTTTYFLHLFNSNQEPSQQRPWQLFIDDPQQTFFNFNFQLSIDQEAHVGTPQKDLTSSHLRDLGLPSTGKLTVFAQA